MLLLSCSKAAHKESFATVGEVSENIFDDGGCAFADRTVAEVLDDVESCEEVSFAERFS